MSETGQDVETQGMKGATSTLSLVDNKEASILIVDDDSADVLFLTEVIESNFDETTNLIIDKAANFEEAMQKVVDNHYNLVLLDYKLGYLNGLDVQKSIKAEKPNIPIVFITGQGNEKTAVEAIKQGALDYLIKDELSNETVAAILKKVFHSNTKELVKQSKQLFMSINSKEGHNKNSSGYFMKIDSLIKLKVKGKFATAGSGNFFMNFDKWVAPGV